MVVYWSPCFTCWTRNQDVHGRSSKAPRRTPPCRGFPIRASQSVPAGTRQAWATGIRIRILFTFVLPIMQVSSQALSILKQAVRNRAHFVDQWKLNDECFISIGAKLGHDERIHYSCSKMMTTNVVETISSLHRVH